METLDNGIDRVWFGNGNGSHGNGSYYTGMEENGDQKRIPTERVTN